jgi:hypothetical protein
MPLVCGLLVLVRLWNEFHRVAFYKNIYRTIDELQVDLDTWLVEYNLASSHPSRYVTEKKRFC